MKEVLIKKEIYLGIITFLISILFLPFSPIYSFTFSIIFLLFFSSFLSREYRIIASFIIVISRAYIIGSRSYLSDLEADLGTYYNVFDTIKNNDDFFDIIFSFKIFAGGVEFGIVCLYKLYSLIFSNITPYDLSIYNAILCSLGAVIWYEIFGIKEIPEKYRGVCAALLLSIMSIANFGFLQRQALSCIFILFAIEVSKKRYIFLFTILAFIFHTTSLPIILIWRYLIRKRMNMPFLIKSVFFFIIIRFLFEYLIDMLLSATGFSKLIIYSEAPKSFYVVSYFAVIIILILLFLNLAYNRTNISKWKTPIVILGFFYIAFLGVVLFSERITFIFYYLYGYFLFISGYKTIPKILSITTLFYCSWFILDKLVLVKSDPFWQRYPIFSWEPFYYLTAN
jgi:wzy protein